MTDVAPFTLGVGVKDEIGSGTISTVHADHRAQHRDPGEPRQGRDHHLRQPEAEYAQRLSGRGPPGQGQHQARHDERVCRRRGRARLGSACASPTTPAGYSRSRPRLIKPARHQTRGDRGQSRCVVAARGRRAAGKALGFEAQSPGRCGQRRPAVACATAVRTAPGPHTSVDRSRVGGVPVGNRWAGTGSDPCRRRASAQSARFT